MGMPMDERRRARGVEVTIEYDHKGGRVTKTMGSMAGRTFFAKMAREGRNPEIKKAQDFQ